MFKSKRILAFIGARAGSKGLKNKNIVNFAGKPLIVWTIKAALGSKYIDRTIVSTDGEQIAKIAREAGADAPFLRPKKMAQDHSLIQTALEHCLVWLNKHEHQNYDYLLCLQPTSPLRTVRHIDEAIEYYFRNKQSNQDSLVSVVKPSEKLGWLMEKNKAGYVHFAFDIKGQKFRRQNIPDYYLPNGAIFLAPIKSLKVAGFYTAHTIPFVMKTEVSIDIDTKEDLKKAERFCE